MSTAKSMAAQYKRNKLHTPSANFKSSTSNLLHGNRQTEQQAASSRLKSTSMTNLIVGGRNESSQLSQGATRIQRPASRNALDSIHNGMNAKYAQVQSKVYLQNIKPQSPAGQQANGGSKIPGNVRKTAAGIRPTASNTRSLGGQQQQDRQTLQAKVKSLQDELDGLVSERDELKLELERERTDKVEQLKQLKQELEDKLVEQDKKSEEYHQKLLEAYEMADQNRRTADSVLAESRQRDEESRKKVAELEAQLGELREFISIKDEMTGKMGELREQIREERERYEEQLKSLHKVFENEKISHLQVDRNSNYFNRVKPKLLQSNESLEGAGGKESPAERGGKLTRASKSTNCRKCQSGSSQLHCSQHDIYGSKLSTRMQDTARSAWRAGKHFASSVITGGAGGLSACRQCTSRRRSSSGSSLDQAKVNGAFNGQQTEVLDEQHTSVIAVAAGQPGDLRPPQSPARCRRASAIDEQAQVASSLIRVDKNNKLTIVTKFNDEPSISSNQMTTNGAGKTAAPSSSASSERSRCESSSSGRGTSSDAGSAASQLGDDESCPTARNNQEPADQQPTQQVMSQPTTTDGQQQQQQPQQQQQQSASKSNQKRHKRHSSLFKASKLFSGSQVSLHKLKQSLFGSKSGASGDLVADSQNHTDQPQLQQVQLVANNEESRARCIELNQAINVASMGCEQVTFDKVKLAPASHLDEQQVCQGEPAEASLSSAPSSPSSSGATEESSHQDRASEQQVDVVRARVALAVAGS